MKRKSTDRKYGKEFFLFLAIMMLTFGVVLRGQNFSQLKSTLLRMKPVYVGAALFLSVFFVTAEGCMICFLLRSVGIIVHVRQCVGYSFAGFFFSGITPSASGGQPMQLYYMKRDGIPLPEGTAVLMAVATAYKFVLAVVGMMILLFWQKLLKEHLGGYFFWYIVGLSLNVLLVILLLLVMLKPVLIRHLTEKIIVMAQKCGMKIPKEKWLEKLDGFLDGYRGTVLFFREHKEKILILIVMTFVQRSSAFLLTFLVYLGFGLSGTAMYQILLLQAAIYVAVDMLPVPGAQGITEAMYGKVFLPVFSGQYLVPAMCVTRGVGFYLMLVIGALWVLKIHYKKIGSGRKKAYTNA